MPHIREFQKGVIGGILRIVVTDDGEVFDLGPSTTHDFVLKDPFGAEKTVNAIFTPLPDGAGDGSDGSLDFVTDDAGDFDVGGSWEAQVDLVHPATIPPFSGLSSITRFRVRDNL